MLRLPRLLSNAQLVDAKGLPTAGFQTWWQQVVSMIERAIALIVTLTGIQDQFEQALQDAQTATAEAQQAATEAQAAATAAQMQVDATSKEAALQGSYIDPDSVVTYDGIDIQIAAHTRYYGDGTSVAVSSGSVTPAGTGARYVSYLDPARSGGAVAFVATATLQSQTGDRHNVGAVTVPGTGTATGGRGPLPPGYVQP